MPHVSEITQHLSFSDLLHVTHFYFLLPQHPAGTDEVVWQPGSVLCRLCCGEGSFSLRETEHGIGSICAQLRPMRYTRRWGECALVPSLLRRNMSLAFLPWKRAYEKCPSSTSQGWYEHEKVNVFDGCCPTQVTGSVIMVITISRVVIALFLSQHRGKGGFLGKRQQYRLLMRKFMGPHQTMISNSSFLGHWRCCIPKWGNRGTWLPWKEWCEHGRSGQF